jgi:cytochrome c biogenesis protein CcmG/thiol:disulfide interchange protein DsbE
MRLRFIVPIALFAALAAVFGFYLSAIERGKDVNAVPSALIGKPAPEFALPPLEGRSDGFSSADLGGRPALVNVFASWCLPCRVEHPILLKLARDGIPIFGINVKDKPEDARAYLAELGDPYTKIGADRDGRAVIDWGVYGYPETFVIDRDRRIQYRHVGPIMPHDVERTIRPLLAKLSK